MDLDVTERRSSANADIGTDVRALRKSRGMTLEELARRTGKSVGWASQMERGLSPLALDDLRDIAAVLEVPVSLFFGTADAPEDERGLIVRAPARRQIGEREAGVTEELLSPDLSDAFEVIHTTIAPGAALAEPRTRATTELIYLVSGRLDIWIEDRGFTVDAGDSVRIRGAAHRWANPHSDPVQAIWVISPPVY